MGQKGYGSCLLLGGEIILRKRSGTKETFTGEQHSLLGFKEEHEPLYPEKRETMNHAGRKGQREQQEHYDHGSHGGTTLPEPLTDCNR